MSSTEELSTEPNQEQPNASSSNTEHIADVTEQTIETDNFVNEAIEQDEQKRGPKKRTGLIAAGVTGALALTGAVGFALGRGGDSDPESMPTSEPVATAEPFDEETETNSTDIPAATESEGVEQGSSNFTINYEELTPVFFQDTLIPINSEHPLNSKKPNDIIDDVEYYLNKAYQESSTRSSDAVHYLGDVSGSESDESLDLALMYAARIDGHNPDMGGKFELKMDEVIEASVIDGRLRIEALGEFSATNTEGSTEEHTGTFVFEFIKQLSDTMDENGNLKRTTVLQLSDWGPLK